MTDNAAIKGLVNAVLLAIDNEDWDSLGKLLDEHAIYEVSGFPPFKGKKAILDYYENIRPIASGTHTLESITVEDNRGISCGQFSGVKKDGSKIELLFADVMEFDQYKISCRRVYFCQPEQ